MHGTITDTLKKRRLEVVEEMRTIAENGVTAKRDLTPSETDRFNTLHAEADKLEQRINAVSAGESRAHELEDSFREVTGREPMYRGERGAQAAEAIRDLALGRRTEGIVLGPDVGEGHITPAAVRSLSIGGGSGGNAGGITVPRSLYGQIVVGMAEGSGLIAAGASILSTETGEDLVVPVETTAPTAVVVAEGTTITGTEPVFGSKTLRAYKYGVLVNVSRELLTDTGTDLESYLANRCGYAIGRAFGQDAISGVGTTEPTGILSQGITPGLTAPAGVLTTFGNQATAGQGTDLLEMLRASVEEPYAATPTSGFLMRNQTASLIRRIKTSTGELVGTRWISDERVALDAFVDNMAASKKPVLFGDWSKVWIRMAGGIRFARSEDFAFDKDEVTFRCLARMDIALVDTNAIKYLATPAA